MIIIVSIIIFLISVILILFLNNMYMIQNYIIDNKNKEIKQLIQALEIKNNELQNIMKKMNENDLYKK